MKNTDSEFDPYWESHLLQGDTEHGLVTDREGRIRYVSEALSDLCDHSPALLPPVVYESVTVGRLQDQLHRALELSRDFKQRIQIERADLDGRRKHSYLLSCQPFRMDEGCQEDLFLISLEKKNQVSGGSLLDSRGFYAHLLRRAPLSILVVNARGKVEIHLGGLLISKGVDVESVAKIEDFVHPDDLDIIQQAIQRLNSSDRNQEQRLQLRLRTEKDTEITWVDALLSSGIAMDGNAVTVFHMYDITALKQHDLGLDQANKLLRDSNKDLENFAFLASHDLQEPLRTIRSMIQLLDEDHLDTVDPETRRIVDYLKKASSRMIVMVQSLMEHCRIGGTLRLQEIDTRELLEDVLNDLRSLIEGHRAKVRVDWLPQIHGYREELGLLFQNLISNAIKFARTDVPPEVQVSASRRGNGWVFAVEDNGLGIPEGFQDKVFHLFQRFHRELPVTGTGIGLAHVKKVVDLHQGSIRFDSRLNEGTRFEIFLPSLAPLAYEDE